MPSKLRNKCGLGINMSQTVNVHNNKHIRLFREINFLSSNQTTFTANLKIIYMGSWKYKVKICRFRNLQQK